MRENEINELLERYLNGKATTEEEETLQAWFDAESSRGNWSWRDVNHRDTMDRRLLENIKNQMVSSPKTLDRHKVLRTWLGAASIVLALGISLSIYLRNEQSQTERIHEQFAQETTPAGSETAILVLADGTTVRLDALQEGTSFSDGTTKINHLGTGGLAYQSASNQGVRARHASKETNTIHIPKGSNFQLSLPDGTRVQLNSGSSLTYPLDFGSTERTVTLLGEAYFDVSHESDRPFVVMARDLDVRVLGTTFNVKSYARESVMAVTLETGSVRVSKGKESLELSPGEEASVSVTNQKLQKRTIDLDHSLAWKNGYFSFESQPIDAIMADVARWYDYTIEFKEPASRRPYNGRIARSRPIEDVLASLEALGDVKLKMEGRRIVVMN